MPSSLGTSESTQNTTTQSQTQPWKPTQSGLEGIINRTQKQLPNTAVTGSENAAFDQLLANAQQGNPFTGQITSLANDLFTGGTDRTGMVNDAYSQYQQQASPYLSPDYLDPAKNPAFNAYTKQLADSAANRVNSMFAGAGRDFSGANMAELGRGITEATLPVFANQYNQNVATQTGLMGNLFNAGGSTAGLLSGMDQTALGNRGMGVAAAGEALNAQNYGANATLQAEAQRRALPLQNLQNISSLLLPIAGLGSQTSGTANSVGTQTMSPVQQAMGWTNVASNFGKGVTGLGQGAQYLGGIFGGLA